MIVRPTLLILLAGCGGITPVASDGGVDVRADAYGTDSSLVDTSASDSDSNDASNGDGGFAVKSVPGLALWLDGTLGITQNVMRVSGWADQSGNANNAAQGMSSFQPTYVPSGIGGLPCIHFDSAPQPGQVLVVPDATSLQFGTGDFLVEVVARYDNAPSATPTIERASATFYGKGDLKNANAGVFFFGNTPGTGATPLTNLQATTYFSWWVTSSNAGYNDGVGRVIGLRRTGSTLELRAARVAVGSSIGSKTVDTSAPGIALNIGAMGGQGYLEASLWRLDGDICEVIAVKGAVSASDLSGIESYLAAKYKL